jgi:hypothetical protein
MTSVWRHAARFVDVLALARYAGASRSGRAMEALRSTIDVPERVDVLAILDSNTLTPSHDDSARAFYARARKRLPQDTDVDFPRRELALNPYSETQLTREYPASRVRTADLEKTREVYRKVTSEDVRRGFLADVDALCEDVRVRTRSGELCADKLRLWGCDDPSAALGPVAWSYSRCSPERMSPPNFTSVDKAGHYSFRGRAGGLNPLLSGYSLVG